jgi:hypothetical protein
LKRLVDLDAPAIIIANEPRLMLQSIQRAIEPIDPPQIPFSPARGFQNTLIRAVDACFVFESGASQPANLGLGASRAVGALLGVSGESYNALYEGWLELAAPSHPFARYPFVPSGWFCSVDPERFVRPDFEATGPIGWAAGDDVVALARDLGTFAGDDSVFTPQLRALSRRLEAVSLRGQAVIGLIEYLSPEADGEMDFFADPTTGDETPSG